MHTHHPKYQVQMHHHLASLLDQPLHREANRKQEQKETICKQKRTKDLIKDHKQKIQNIKKFKQIKLT